MSKPRHADQIIGWEAERKMVMDLGYVASPEVTQMLWQHHNDPNLAAFFGNRPQVLRFLRNARKGVSTMINLSKYIALGAPFWFASTTVLHLAVFGQQDGLVEEILYELGDEDMIDVESTGNVTAFHLAAANENEQMVEGLLEQNFDPCNRDQFGLNCVTVVNCFNTRLIKRLMGKDAFPHFGAWPFDEAAARAKYEAEKAKKQQEKAAKMKNQHGRDVQNDDESDYDSDEDEGEVILLKSPPCEVYPLLARAIKAGAYETTKLLIRAGAPPKEDFNWDDEYLGMLVGVPDEISIDGQDITLLNAVIAYSGRETPRLEIVREMIKSQAQMRINDLSQGYTAMMRAVMAKSPALVKLLLQKCPGADVNIYSEEGKLNCLIAAVESRQCYPDAVCRNLDGDHGAGPDVELFQLLAPRLNLASFDAVNAAGEDAITIATRRHHAELLRLLKTKYAELQR